MPDPRPCAELADVQHGPHRYLLGGAEYACPGSQDPVRSSLATDAVATAVAAEQPRDPLLLAAEPTLPAADATLFRLRDVLAVTEERTTMAWLDSEQPTAQEAHDLLRDAARELARLVRELDQGLTAGARLPREWARELVNAQPPDFYELVGRLRNWLDREPPFGPGDVIDLRALLDELEEWGNQPVATVELAADGTGSSSCGRACSEGHTYDKGCLLDLAWDFTQADDGSRDVAANQESAWRPSGHETSFPCMVHVRVTYRDGTDAYYPVPPTEGWRLDTRTRELVIGKGVPRTHVPLDAVWCYAPEPCGGDRIEEHEQGPTARGAR